MKIIFSNIFLNDYSIIAFPNEMCLEQCLRLHLTDSVHGGFTWQSIILFYFNEFCLKSLRSRTLKYLPVLISDSCLVKCVVWWVGYTSYKRCQALLNHQTYTYSKCKRNWVRKTNIFVRLFDRVEFVVFKDITETASYSAHML